MTDDASTAYICIYCPFNSDNLQALEYHLTNAHGYGNQETLPAPSPSNSTTKAPKREAPDDEQSPSSSDGLEQSSEHSLSVKRLKGASSSSLSLSTNVIVNRSVEYSDPDDDEENDHIEEDEEGDERDSSSIGIRSTQNEQNLTCAICSINFESFPQLLQHTKREHPHEFPNHYQNEIFDVFKTIKESNSVVDMEKHPLAQREKSENEHAFPSSSIVAETTENAKSSAVTKCPYCDYKTTDIEQFKAHIIAHIRDKNYRCLLCNRLYKYRGDCSFHIRRKHHRYSQNFNNYIQRFVFDTTDGDESTSGQAGGVASLVNGSTNHSNNAREPEEPARYFGCPYCDYTSNYGGDVRKHQARKHPNVESKVIKILRQESEQQQQQQSQSASSSSMRPDGDEEDDEDPSTTQKTPDEQSLSTPPFPSSLPILTHFAPVRVFQCSACHQQGTYKWVVERHIRAKHPDQADARVIELPAELSVKLQKITSPLKRFRCSLCSLQSKHSWVVLRHIKHFHTLQTASVLDIQPDGKPIPEQPSSYSNGDFANKSTGQDSESSSASSSCVDLADPDESQVQLDSMVFNYKCSICDYQSSISWNIQKHINEKHSDQSNAYVLTQCRQRNLSSNEFNAGKASKAKANLPTGRALSPASALAKAKFSPAVEEALLSLQGSKLSSQLYAVQPKFGIKRLKCRHCFYRSNWKTDMIRHVRIRHNITEPDHHKDMIMMTEQEARSTIESYENTFGKELRRRTFRTWNDWSKAEQEFTPRDGSLQYANPEPENQSTKKTNRTGELKSSASASSSSTTTNEPKRSMKVTMKKESDPTTKVKTIINPTPTPLNFTDEFKTLPNPSNIVSRLLLTTKSPETPSITTNDDAPLDLSLKSSTNVGSESEKIDDESSVDRDRVDQDDDADDDDDRDEEDEEEESSSVLYLCSVCPYKRRNWSSVHQHLSLHINGQGSLCPCCSFVSSNSTSMIRHFADHHPTSQIPSKFSSPSVQLSATILEQHQCSFCSYQCENDEALNLHCRLEHNDDDEEYDIDTSENDEEDDHNVDSPVRNGKSPYECPICSPTSSDENPLNNLEDLTMHVIRVHHHHQSCPFCSFTTNTTTSQTLIQHVQLHFNGTLIQPDPHLALEQVKELLIFE